MFARHVSFRLKPNLAAEATQTFEKEIVPLLRKQKGFRDEITLLAADGREAVGISIWDQKESAEAYERSTYYADTWAPAFERWVRMLAGMYRGPGRERVAWNSALIYDMIYTQPVLYELEQLRMPVLLMIDVSGQAQSADPLGLVLVAQAMQVAMDSLFSTIHER